MLIKDAAKNLYDKKEITEEEYSELNKLAFNIPDEELGAFIKTIISKGKREATPISKFLQNAQLGLLGIGGGTGAVLGGEELYRHFKRQGDINNSFNTMQEKVPSLTEYPQDKIKDYFEVIKTFSPKSASNPLVAGALVHKMLEFGGVDHKLVQDLSRMEMPQSGIFYELAKSSLGGLSKIPKDTE
jgi:hypothetical protein